MKKFLICMILMIVTLGCTTTKTSAVIFYDTRGTIYDGIVHRVARLGIINGVAPKAFAPYKSITRAELAKMIVVTKGFQKYVDDFEGETRYKDTKGHWGDKYITVATDLGLLNGYDDGTFKPDKEVSYAEVIAVLLRILGYVNIDETQGDTWYFGYTKRMYEISLDKGLPQIEGFEAPAKRGDVVILWWNMLVSEKWAIVSETEGTGMRYTYSQKTQLETLFPSYRLIRGRLSSMISAESGDYISLRVSGFGEYYTDTILPIYALGATITGIYDVDGNIVYGVSFDDDLEAFEVVSGPISYLKKQGYSLKGADYEYSFGNKSEATYAYLVVSKTTGKTQRIVYIDASRSYYIDSLKIEEQKRDEEEKKKDDDEDEVKIYDIYINGSEEPLAQSYALIIKDGKIVRWADLPIGSVLTELIPRILYTYEETVLDGRVINCDDLDELIVDYDNYVISQNCVYKIFGEKNEVQNVDKEKIKYHDYNSKMTKAKFKELLNRNIKFYLNVAEEISMIEFGKYKPTNSIEKYDNDVYCFFYIKRISAVASEKDDIDRINGITIGGRSVRFDIKNSEGNYRVGDLVLATGIEGNTAKSIEIVSSDMIFEEDDIMVIYDSDAKLVGKAFGEYLMNDDTIIFNINKNYRDNSNTAVQTCTITQVSDIEEIDNLSKSKVILLCNTNMDIEVMFIEKELNKTAYPVGRVLEATRIYDESRSDDKNSYYIGKFRISQLGGRIKTYNLSPDACKQGELITFEIIPDREDEIKIKERFDTVFIGYEKDLIVKEFDKENKIAKFENSNVELDLKKSVYNNENKKYDLLSYRYILATVKFDKELERWVFTSSEFYDKEELELLPNDRIAFGELNGIAVIYRGYYE